MKIFKKMKKGFTLVELVVVIAVIAILAAVSVGAYFGVTESANNSRLEQEAKQIYTAIQTVSLAPNEHSFLSKDGFVITDDSKFESALEETLGKNVTLLENGDKAADEPTIYFVRKAVSPEISENVVYSSFEYHVAEINGKKAVADIVTGEVKVETSNVEAGEDSSTTTVPGATTDPITDAPDVSLDGEYREYVFDSYESTTAASGFTLNLSNQISFVCESNNGVVHSSDKEIRIYQGKFITLNIADVIEVKGFEITAKASDSGNHSLIIGYNSKESNLTYSSTISSQNLIVDDATSYTFTTDTKQIKLKSIKIYGTGFEAIPDLVSYDIKLSSNSNSIYVGEEATVVFAGNKNPENASNPNIDTVEIVSGGEFIEIDQETLKITAKAAGTAVIKAKDSVIGVYSNIFTIDVKAEATGQTTTYDFSTLTNGEQYAEGEEHSLDENTTLIINGAHLNTQVRLYAGSNAVVESTNTITKVVLNAGYKAGTLNVYSSTNGEDWDLVRAQTTTTAYTEYAFEISNCKFIKMEGIGAQIRVSKMKLTTIA